jgi:hypothetical protein
MALDEQRGPAGARAGETDVYLEMKQLAEPWVSLETLQHTDSRIVRDIVRNAERLQQRLGGELMTRGRAMLPSMSILGLIGLGAMLAWMVNEHINDDTTSTLSVIMGGVRHAFYQTYFSFSNLEYTSLILVGVALMLIIGVWTLRSMRQF